MIKKLFSLSHKTLFIILILLVAVGIGVYMRGNNKITKAEYPQYYNFSGNYVFSVPKSYSVDEQSIPGIQIIYTGTITAKTLEDVYNSNGIAIQAITDLTDHSSGAFKKYVNDKYLPELKKNLSTTDVQLKFGKTNGADNASITAKKDGKAFRFIFLKGGLHPAAIVAKQEISAIKDVERTLTDVEKSDLKTEADIIKDVIKNTATQVKAQKSTDIYNSAAPELRTKSSEAQLDAALKTAAAYTNVNITISGVGYSPTNLSAVMRMTKPVKDDQQLGIGILTYKKTNNLWLLESLTLPSPKQ